MQDTSDNKTIVAKEAGNNSTNGVSSYHASSADDPINVPSNDNSDSHIPFTCMEDYLHGTEPEIEDSVPMKEEEGKAFYRVVNLLEKVTLGPGSVEAVESLSRVVNQLSQDSK